LDTAITLPIGAEAYGAQALRAWLAADRAMNGPTRAGLSEAVAIYQRIGAAEAGPAAAYLAALN